MRAKVFIDDSGRFYKAVGEKPVPAAVSHAERPHVTDEFLAVLPEDGTPMYMVDIDEAVRLAQCQPKVVLPDEAV